MHRTQVNTTIDAAGRCRMLLAAMLSWLGASAAAAASDGPPLILEHLTTLEGLPQGTVMDTLQDSQGFVWLGTQDGLVRYDGHELVRYAYSRNLPSGLPGNFINRIVEDPHHDLWIAIKDAGLARWNRATDRFTVYRHDPADPGSLASDSARTVLVDALGRIWVGTSNAGVDILEPASGRITHLRHSDNPDSLIDDRVFTLAIDRSGTVWVGTAGGLERWQSERSGFAHLLGGSQISQVLEDQSGSLWVGTFDRGLDRIEPDGRVARAFRHDARQPNSLSGDDIRALLEDHAGHLWIGTTDGLDLLDRASGRFSHYRHDERDPTSLRDSYVQSLYEDATGLLWIGTREGGVSRWNPRSWELGGYRPDWLAGRDVTAFADAANDKLWIASLGGGLVQFDPASGEASDIDAIVGRRNALGDRRVMALRQDRHGALWIGTMASGLKKLSATGRLDTVAVKPGDPHALSDAGIMTIFEARSGELWIGTHDGGVNVLDPASGSIRQLPYGDSQPGAISAAAASAIVEDPSGNIWIGTDGGGLDLARPDGSVMQVFRHDPKDPVSLPANTVYALAVDAKGRVWVGTDGGGVALVVGSASTPSAIRFQVVSRDDGLSSDTIYGVLPDAAGQIWLSGNAGLMRLDPESHAVKTFHREHGVQGEEFNFGAFYRLRDGRLCFGGPGGFNLFDPARLSEDRLAPRLALTRVEILGVPMPSATPYWLLDRIVVDHRASIISLDFGALDFISPKRNRLAYRMAGLTDRWIDLGTQHRITLTNLEPGDHVLEVRAANADSVWSEQPLRLTIHRQPAPWRSRWAYAGYALAALGLILFGVLRQRRRFRQIVAARERLETEVALRTRELLESNRQLAQAARAKSDFLDRMSHELRTPMNGVVGMTELLARTPLSSMQSRLTQTIRSSAQVLLQIVNDLLDLSRIQAGKIQLEALPIDLVALLEECTALFMGAADNKNIDLIVCPPVLSAGCVIGDPLRIRQILMNLIGNAVKFTAQGEVVVRAEVDCESPQRARLRISVADTGIGMDAATIEKIFEPFTQADESTSRRFGGSGLGLAICRELTELLGGSISVDSRPQAGSTFTLSLPLTLRLAPADLPGVAPPSCSVQIFTRRPALAEALARHVTALGLRLHPPVDGDAPHFGHAHVLLVEAGSYPQLLRSYSERAADPAAVAGVPALVVIASSNVVETQDLARVVPASCIVAKPVQRAALQEALRAAIGTPAPAAAAMGAADAPDASGALGASAARGASGAAGMSAPPAFWAGAAHVLLVEDEPVNAAVAQGYLSTLGCSSVWVEDGPQAVSRSAAERFDLILMDLSMPGMDGFATTQLIRAREGGGRRVPIVALTAHDAASYRDTCLLAGIDDLLTKPYTLQQCEQLLRRWIGNRVGTAPAPASAPAVSAATDAGSSAPPVRAALTSVDTRTVKSLRNLRPGAALDLYSQLVTLFRTGSSKSLAELRAQVQQGDFKVAAATCHKLAASAANVGALVFAQDVRLLGQRCLAGDTASVVRLHQDLQAAHPALLEALARAQLRESA
jgi:signal transduction histidine kinase/ligand-binding sensor domain-containing protein/CheY-like chemotaxis protein/HPt (histidine-containing phosphotransfer) domain-containing protein